VTTPIRITVRAGIFVLSLLAGIIVVSNAHVGVVRLVVVFAFLTIAPGGALLNVVLPDLSDWPTTLLLAIGASLAMDVASTETALWAHTWDPAGVVGALALLAAALSGLSLVRLQSSQVELPGLRIGLPAWSRRVGYWPFVALPVAVMLAGLIVDFVGGHPKRAVTGVTGGVAAGLATAIVVAMVFTASSMVPSERRRRGLIASSVLVALVVAIVTARFLLIG
jgi:hypothetical protein